MCHQKFVSIKVAILRKKLPCVTESLRTFRSAREREGRAQAEVLQSCFCISSCWLLMRGAFDPVWGLLMTVVRHFRSDPEISPIVSRAPLPQGLGGPHHPGEP